MIGYVKTLSQYIAESSDPLESAFNAAQTKYEDAKTKDAENYKNYTDGKTTKDQYMSTFMQLLDIERAYRIAQINYKLEASRGNDAADKTGQQPSNANNTPNSTTSTPGTAAGNGGNLAG